MRYMIIVALFAAGCGDAPFKPTPLPVSSPPVPAPPESGCYVISQGRIKDVPCPEPADAR